MASYSDIGTQTHEFAAKIPQVAQHSQLLQWFDEAIKPELEIMNAKLDNLMKRQSYPQPQPQPCLQPYPQPQPQLHPQGSRCSGLGLRQATALEQVLTKPVLRKCSVMSFNDAAVYALPALRSSRVDDAAVQNLPSNGSQSSWGSKKTDSQQSGGCNARSPKSSQARRSVLGPLFPRFSAAVVPEKSVDTRVADEIIYKPRMFPCLDQIWMVLEDPESSKFALWLAQLMPAFILSSVFVTLFQTIDPAPLSGVPAAVVETVIDSIFLLELLLRFVACPNRMSFFLSIFNWIDMAAAAPLFVRAAIDFVLPLGPVESVPQGVLLCAVPIVRLLKTLRRFEKIHLLLKAFELLIEALPVLMFMLFIIAMSFAVLIYLAEPRDNMPSLPHAFFFTIVTMTTVGYGNVVPTSVLGSFIAGVLIVITILYMAVPLGIIGNAFTQTWNDRDKILLTQRTRERLRQWGYAAKDIPLLFRVSGSNRMSSNLSIDEFHAMLKRMHIGFSDERIYQLFQSFDANKSGTIDDREFVRTLFPNSFHDIYQDQDSP